VNNLNKKSVQNTNSQNNHSWSTGTNVKGVILMDRHTQSLSPNQGETTTSGNGESSQVPGVKLHEVIEDIDSEVSLVKLVKEHPLGKIDRII